MTLSRSRCHEALFPALSLPPRLLCRSPGPGLPGAGLNCARPHEYWVFRLIPARDATERARDRPRWTHLERLIARAFRRSSSAPPTVICPVLQPTYIKYMHAAIICRPYLPKFGAIAANTTFWQFIATRPGADKAASQLTTSPSLSLSWPRPISSKPKLSQTALISGLQAHTGS